MKLTPAQVLARLAEARQEIEQQFEQSTDPAQRAAHLSALLRKLVPTAAVHACLLCNGGSGVASVRDRKGNERLEWAHLDWAAKATAQPTLPAQWGLRGQRLVWEEVAATDRSRGGLGVAVPEDLAPGQEATLRNVLQTLAALLSGRLAGEEARREQQALHDDGATNRGLADLGEVAAPVAHEFNNFLNAMLLHVAVLEMKLAPEHRQGLADLRQQGKGMAAIVQQWQNYRRIATDGRTVDLNEQLHKAAQAVTGSDREQPEREGVLVAFELQSEPLPVPGSAACLMRLFSFLLRNAAAVTPLQETITVRTKRSEGRAFVQIADRGPALDPERLPEFFELNPRRRDGRNSLELAACKTLVRRLQGKLSADNAPVRGVVVTVELEAG